MLLGTMRSAAEHGVHRLDPLATAQALGLTVAAVAVLAGTHRIRRDARTTRNEQDERTAAAEHERAQALADEERAERAREARRQADEREAERSHIREVQRTKAYADGERLRAEADERAAERAHALALAERTAERSAPERPPPSARRAPARLDDVTARRREQAHATWAARERSPEPMAGPELAQLLGVSDGRARAVIAEWRNPKPTRGEATP